MRAGEAIADAIVAHGVDTIFGLLGDANMFLVADLVQRHGVRFVAARNENAAVMMADGWARATGRCGVVTVTQGPGLAVAGAALTIARQAGTPLVLIAGDTPPGDPLHVQSFPQQPFALATAGAFVPVTAPATAARDVGLAFRAAAERPGPVVLDVPIDLQDEPVPAGAAPAPAVAAYRPASPAPTDAAVAELVGLLAAARRPVLLAGRGAEAAADDVRRLADWCGAVLATTVLAAGLFAGHPYHLGVAGGLARPLTRRVLAEADLVVTLGAGLNRWTADHGALFPGARVVAVDVDARALGARWPVDLGIVGDAAVTARAVTARLDPVSARSGAVPPWPRRSPRPTRSTASRSSRARRGSTPGRSCGSAPGGCPPGAPPWWAWGSSAAGPTFCSTRPPWTARSSHPGSSAASASACRTPSGPAWADRTGRWSPSRATAACSPASGSWTPWPGSGRPCCWWSSTTAATARRCASSARAGSTRRWLGSRPGTWPPWRAPWAYRPGRSPTRPARRRRSTRCCR